MPRLAERHPQQRALMVVAAKAEIASTLVSELQHDRADVAEGKTPLGGLDAVAREPEIGTAHCLAPGVEVIECQHAAVPLPDQTRFRPAFLSEPALPADRAIWRNGQEYAAATGFHKGFPPNPQFSPLPTSIATIPRIAIKSHLTLILEHPQ
jgi:hypothetical protein